MEHFVKAHQSERAASQEKDLRARASEALASLVQRGVLNPSKVVRRYDELNIGRSRS